MWSGGPQWTQWALNPSAYQNVSHEQIDWAALAQQWIKMKESHSVPPPVHLQAPPPPPPPPLPPPQQQQQQQSRHQSDEVKEKEVVAPREAEEGGEAPMEMDAKEEEEEDLPSGNTPSTSVNPPVTTAAPLDASSSWGSWNNWQQPQHWGPGWHGPAVGTAGSWAGPPSSHPPPPNHPHAHITAPAGTKEPPGVSVGVPPPTHQMGAHFPFPPHNATGPMYGDHSHPPSFDYNHGVEGVDHFGQVGFWGAGEAGADMGPSPFIRHNRHSDWRGNRGPPGMSGRPYHDHQGRHGPSEHSDEEEDQSGGTVLDAAKRRQLPAWIREGLEKMEREKMKQLERERLLKEREAVQAKKLKDQEQLAVRELGDKEDGMTSSNMVTIPKRSKFESDSEEDDEVNADETSDRSMEWRSGIAPLKRRKRSRFQDASSPGSPSPHDVIGIKAGVGHPNGRRKMSEIAEDDEGERGRSPVPTPMSREELMQETMLKVRRLLTEVLLEVTNEEMQFVAKEVLSNAKSKAPALQLRKTPALATLTGQLGLGMYGDSESSEESDYGESGKGDRYGRRRAADAECDSDEELKDQIRRRKQDFAQTEREIEAHLQEEEEREREREREREKRLMGEELANPGTGEEGNVVGGVVGKGDVVDSKESSIGGTGEMEERQVEKETDSNRPSLQQEGIDSQKPKSFQPPDNKEAEEIVGEAKDEKQGKKGNDVEVRSGDAKSRPAQATHEKPNSTSRSSDKHERKKTESKRKKKRKGTSSQSESHTSSRSSSSATSTESSSSSSSSSDSTSSSRSSSPSSSSESSDSRHQSRKRSKPSKELSRKDAKGKRVRRGSSGDTKSVRRRRRSRSRERSRGRGGRGEEGGRKGQREGGGDGRSRRDDDSGSRHRGRGHHRGGNSRSPDRKDRRRGGEKDGGRRRNGRRSVTPRKGHRSRSRSDRRRHSGGGRRSSSRSSSYAELSKKQGHGYRD